MKVDEEMKQPLLLSVNDEVDPLSRMARNSKEFDSIPMQRLRLPTRVKAGAPRGSKEIQEEVKGVEKIRTNTFKIPKVDKFNSGLKTDKLNEFKEEQDRWKREHEDLKQRD